MIRCSKPPLRANRRGAALYCLVMSVTLIVALLALSGLTVLRVDRRSAGRKHEAEEARRYAQAAVEMGLLRIQNNPAWRTVYTSGVWELNQPIGEGTYTLEGIDPNDGNLATPATDPVVLIGTGVMGSARQKVQVTLVPETLGLSCLEVALHANDYLKFTGATVQCNQTISANDTVDEATSTINADVEAVNAINGTGYTGTTTTGITPRTTPDPVTVFDYYVANGTTINFSDLPGDPGYKIIEKVVISPTNNPWGATNPEGIYVIDCGSNKLKIEKCRIYGTLVLLNCGAGSSSRTKFGISWEPAVANYPALLVQGTYEFHHDAGDLDEISIGINFNPQHTPYPPGNPNAWDDDKDDQYPSVIKGLIYVSNDVYNDSTKGAPTFEGVMVVGKSLDFQGRTFTFTYDTTFLNNPPPGFGAPPVMKIPPGSWQKNVD